MTFICYRNNIIALAFATTALAGCSTEPVQEPAADEAEAVIETPQNLGTYPERYLASAAQGNADAQYNMGNWYEEDRPNSPKDLVKAYVWYKLAANQGDYGSKFALERFEAQLTPPQRADAERLLKKWRPGDTLE